MAEGNPKKELSGPLYRQLMESLKNDITSGVYPVHSRIPTEEALCELHQVSRVTVRKALLELTKEGLLERHQGKGTYVCTPRMHRDLGQITSFHDSCMAMGCEPGTRVLHARKAAAVSSDVQELQLPESGEVVEIVRLRLADGQPVALEYNRFPDSYAWLLSEDLNGSVYGLLRARKIEPSRAVHEISLTIADGNEAKLLDVEPGTALLCLRETIYDQKGDPLHSSLQKIRGDRFTFRI